MNIYNRFKFNNIVKHVFIDSVPKNKAKISDQKNFYSLFSIEQFDVILPNKCCTAPTTQSQHRIENKTGTMPNRMVCFSI